jgi:hypothetical protein
MQAMVNSMVCFKNINIGNEIKKEKWKKKDINFFAQRLHIEK